MTTGNDYPRSKSGLKIFAKFEFIRPQRISSDSPVAAYLRSRGFNGLSASEQRVIQECAAPVGHIHSVSPCLCARIERGADETVAFQLLPISNSGEALEWVDDDYKRIKERRTIKPSGMERLPPDAAVRLGPVTDGCLAIAEGVETAMSFMRISGIPCWALMGWWRFKNFTPPPDATTLLVAQDNDDWGAKAVEHLRRRHDDVRPWKSSVGNDFNDLLRSKAK